MTIYAYAFDYDGCLCHEKFVAQCRHLLDVQTPDPDIVVHNRRLLDTINAQAMPTSQKIVLLASLRQSHLLDRALYASERLTVLGSAFTAITHIATALDAKLDDLLWADVLHARTPGTAFKRSLAASANTVIHDDCKIIGADSAYDHSKCGIVYAQLHKLALDHPQYPLIYHLYDNNERILSAISHFFTKQPVLLPPHTSLQLYHYAGKNATLHTHIISQGKHVDQNYCRSSQHMAYAADKLADKQRGYIAALDNPQQYVSTPE